MSPLKDSLAANSPPRSYIDRRPSLVFFGVVTVLLGEAGIVLLGFGVTGMVIAARYSSLGGQPRVFLSISVWAILAVALVWLGIGSIMARRWARAWLLLLSWNWFLRMPSMLPPMVAGFRSGLALSQRSVSPEIRTITLWTGFLILGGLFVILPLICAILYGSKHVKATCEACDPVARWTDRCPTPILVGVFWAGSSAASMLLSIGTYRGVFSFFGSILTGPPGSAAHLIMALLWAYCAWTLYHLEMRGWWLMLASVTVLSISTIITYSHHDVLDYYTAIGYTGRRSLQGSNMRWIAVDWALPMLGYLLYARRYFPRRTTEPLASRI